MRVATTVIFALLLAACAAPALRELSPTPSAAGTAEATARGGTLVTPPPARPTSPPWSARSPAEVLANLPGDDNFVSMMAALSSPAGADPRVAGRTPSLEAPIFVRGLWPGDGNEYLVPVNVGDTTIALMKVTVDFGGLGRLEAARGWSATPSFPAISEAAAVARGSTTADPVIEAEFVWSNIRGSADALQPFWSLTRASRAVFFLFEDGTLIPAT